MCRIFDRLFYFFFFFISFSQGCGDVFLTSAPEMKREPVVCLWVAPCLGGGARTHRRGPGVRCATSWPTIANRSGAGTSRGRARQRALPKPSPSDSPLSARCDAESRRVKREIMLLLLIPYPLTPQKSREACLLLDGRSAAALAAGDSAPAFRSPLDCLFCCQRTYQDVSCWRF